jgi:Zn-dependent protease with chaperone function
MSETTAMRIREDPTGGGWGYIGRVDRRRVRLPVALVAAAVVAEAAVVALRPRAAVIQPARVSAGSYFTAEQIARARDFRRPQLALYAGQLALEGALLLVLARRPPRLLSAGRHQIVAGAATGAALSVALTVVTLPLGVVLRQRAVEVGLVTQSWSGWGWDLVKSGVISATLAAGGSALLLGLMRRFPRHWWAPASGLAVLVGAAFLYAGPVILDPVFNRFERLPPGQTRSDVLDLARDAGVRVGQIYEVDASRRTTAANAYVTGLGSTKRVVLYDTLLEHFSRDEVRLVVAHELAHVHYRDVPRGLLYLALVAPAAMLAVQRLTERLSPARGTPAVLPAAALSLALVSGAVGIVSNQLSRRVEQRADSFSLRLTRAPQPFIAFERGITVRNVVEPDPPGWVVALLATHPPAVERIGAAVAYDR